MADKPSLRFADGGSLITRWARSVMRPDNTANRLRQAEAPAPALAAPPAPPPKVQDPSRVTADNPAGIRFQDGGVVPGKGKGDKIPAKYEPGEFVVSNDMIEDNPGLREELSSLRAETLARRGKTVAEADAGIVTPKGLRAADGFDPFDRMARTLTGQNATPPRSPMGATAQDLGRGPIGGGPAQGPTQGPTQGPANPNVGQGRASVEAQAWQQGRAAPAAAPAPAAPAPQGKLYGPARAAGSFLRNFTPAAAIGGAIDGLNTDTEQYAKRFGLENTEPGLLRDVSIRALGVASDIGNNLAFGMPGELFRDKQESDAPTATKPVGAPAAAPTKPAAPTNYRGKGYDDPRRVDMDPSRQSLGDSRDLSKELAGLPGKMPGGMHEGMIYKTTDENGRTVYSGTNVREGAGFVDGRGANIGSRGSVNTVPGMSQAQIDATLTNPDGSRWSANDNAIMAANLRDGVDPYRGTSRGAAAAGGNQFQAPQNELYDGGGFGLLSNRARNERRLKMDAEQLKPGARTALKAFYEGEKEHRKNQTDVQRTAMSEDGALKRTAMTDGTTRRGQDMDLQGERLDVQGRYAAENAKLLREDQMRQMTGAIYEQAGGNVERAKALALRMGLPELAKSFDGMATTEQTRSFNASNNAREDFQAFNPDGTPNKAESDAAYQAVTKILPGYDRMSEDARKQLKPEAQALTNIYNRLRNNPEMGWDKVNPFNTKGAPRDSLPNFKGGKLVQNGAAGLITPGSGVGEWYIEKDGKRLPLGNLSEREIEILEHQTKTGEWLGAPKKTQKGG